MKKHYVYVVRDTVRRQNTIDITPTLRAVERRINLENRKDAEKVYPKKIAAALAKCGSDPEKAAEALEGLKDAKERHAVVHLIYYECLPGEREARKRMGYLVSDDGRKELRRWLQRWDKAEIHE